MGLFIPIISIFTIFIISGCSEKKTPAPITVEIEQNVKDNNLTFAKNTATSEIKSYYLNEEMKKKQIPKMKFHSVYEDISVFDNQKISFSTRNANFHKVLYSISKLSDLNLIIDSNVESDKPITLSVKDAELKSVLDIVMNISGCYYTLDGNVLHVKQFMRKEFFIPYVHSTTSFTTDLGGDTLGSANNGSSSGGGSTDGAIKGEFKLQFSNPDTTNDFYTHLEDSIKALVGKKGSYTLNKFSGMLTVHDVKKNVDAISTMIHKIKEKTSKSVLIEAKILEITLDEGHQLGINWDSVSSLAGGELTLGQTLGLSGATAGSIAYTSENGNFNAMITALDSSGDVDTLSNPRIKVLSGQSAIISSGKLVPFWEKEVQTDQGTGGSASNTQVTYNRRDVLNGLTMGVTPTIMEDGKIMLNVIPITSSIATVIDHKDEDGNSVASAPVLDIKEAGTIIYANDGELVLIGGLISNSKKEEVESVPLLGDIPYLGWLFQRTITSNEKKELVILIKLKVL